MVRTLPLVKLLRTCATTNISLDEKARCGSGYAASAIQKSVRGKGKGRGASMRPRFCQRARLLRASRANRRASALRAGREEEGPGGAALSLELVCQCSHVRPPPMAAVASEPNRWRAAARARNSVHAHKMAAFPVLLTGRLTCTAVAGGNCNALCALCVCVDRCRRLQAAELGSGA